MKAVRKIKSAKRTEMTNNFIEYADRILLKNITALILFLTLLIFARGEAQVPSGSHK